MSHELRMADLRQKFSALSQEVNELKNLRKVAFVAAPPMPQAGAPAVDPNTGMPMDPAMMQAAPPAVDPNTGMPMDPAMMQGGMPPGGPQVDPNTGMPIDPAAMQGDPSAQVAPPSAQAAPPIDPALIDQIVGLMEEMGRKVQEQGAAIEELKTFVSGELQDLGDQVDAMEKRFVESEVANKPAGAPVGSSW